MICKAIPELMPMKQTRKNYSRRMFTKEEDEKLLILVEKHEKDWRKISNDMIDRSIRQCKERYFHYLSPNIKKEKWTDEEDMILLMNIGKQGKKWKVLEKLFPGRTEIDIRNRYYVLIRKISKSVRKQISGVGNKKKICNDKEKMKKLEIINNNVENTNSKDDIKNEINMISSDKNDNNNFLFDKLIEPNDDDYNWEEEEDYDAKFSDFSFEESLYFI